MTGKRQGDNLYKYQHIIIIHCASNICLIFMCVYIILYEGSGTLGRSGTLFQRSVIGKSLGEKVRWKRPAASQRPSAPHRPTSRPKTQDPPLKNTRVVVVVEYLYPYILKIPPYIDPHF